MRVPLGLRVYGAAACALGLIQLVWGDFSTNWHPVQPGVPFRRALVYGVGVVLLVAGAAVQRCATARAGLAALAVLYTLAALLWLPRIVGYPQIFGTWGGFAEQFVDAAAAVIGLASLAASPAAGWRRAGRVAFGSCVAMLGLNHLFALGPTAAMVPAWIPPGQRFWAAATGVAMLVAGVAIVAGVRAALAARGFAFLIGTFALLVWMPRLLAAPLAQNSWGGTTITVAVMAAGWIAADALRPARAA